MSFQDEQNETNIKKIGLLIKKLVFLPVLPPPPIFGGPKKGFVAVGFMVAFFWCSTAMPPENELYCIEKNHKHFKGI